MAKEPTQLEKLEWQNKALLDALQYLVDTKKRKDSVGKDSIYESRKRFAWRKAEQLLEGHDYIPKDPATKLKAAAEDIKDVCRKYDIAAAFGLHTPGHGEFVLQVTPSYSSVYMYQDNELRFYSKRKDFKSDQEQLQKQADTCNMLRLLTDITAQNFLMLKQLSDKADSLTQAVHVKPIK